VIEPEALPERIAGASQSGPQLGGDATLEAIEREYIRRVIARTASLDEAAKVLGVDGSTLWRKRKKYLEES
jgi:NtrC-family two-component system response regulator AlgB